MVAPRAGAWIETSRGDQVAGQPKVAPRAGAWIETGKKGTQRRRRTRRPPCGGVD